MLLSTEKKLPVEIENVLNGTKRFRCRIGWKSFASGYKSHGEWHDLSQEEILKSHVDDANRRHMGHIGHWIEYE